MKSNLKSILTLVVLATTLIACKNKAKEAETSQAEEAAEAKIEAVKYIVDTEASTIDWKGFKPTGSHNGIIKVESGAFAVNGDVVESGSFLIAMNSITVTDIPADDENNGKLTGHLKHEDFFDVVKHPNAAFEITGLKEADSKTMLSGNLTLKDVKNNVTFPVTVSKNGDDLTLTSETFTIDRSKWNVKYGSKSFFDNLGDKFINDDIELKVHISAKKS